MKILTALQVHRATSALAQALSLELVLVSTVYEAIVALKHNRHERFAGVLTEAKLPFGVVSFGQERQGIVLLMYALEIGIPTTILADPEDFRHIQHYRKLPNVVLQYADGLEKGLQALLRQIETRSPLKPKDLHSAA